MGTVGLPFPCEPKKATMTELRGAVTPVAVAVPDPEFTLEAAMGLLVLTPV